MVSASEPSVDRSLSERRGYHHGNLREVLIEAARRLISERGPAGFTLSDAAKLAGVSPAAPYRHFKDRESLLTEVARLGFVKLGEALGRATAAAGHGPEAFFAMGRAYLAFAREEPAFYAAMFNTGLHVPPGSDQTQERAGFGLLEQAIGKALGLADGPARHDAAVLVYALTHGLASLSAPGAIAVPGGLQDPDRALRRGVGALLRGLPVILKEDC